MEVRAGVEHTSVHLVGLQLVGIHTWEGEGERLTRLDDVD